jgi:hypothetical protein
MTKLYKKVLTIDCRPERADAYFKFEVETEYERGYIWELDSMCDSHNTFCRKTGRQLITVMATDAYHNVYNDDEPFSVLLSDELAREVVRTILDDEQDSLWFTKDRLSYAEKHGKII